MADQVVPSTPYTEDIIVLDGQVFPIRGKVQADMLSEFEVGLKTGNADYDQRTQAFYHVYDDFSMGMGYRRQDIRDPKHAGVFWDYDPDIAAADTRRPGHLTLPPLRTDVFPVAPSVVPSNNGIVPSIPYATNGACWGYGFGSAIYHTSDGITFPKAFETNAGICTAIVVYPSGYQNIRTAYFAIFRGSTPIPYWLNTADLCSGTWRAGHVINSAPAPPAGPPQIAGSPSPALVAALNAMGILSFTGPDSQGRIFVSPDSDPTASSVFGHPIFFGSPGSHDTPPPPTTVRPTNPYSVPLLTDGIFWDEKIIVAGQDQGLFFGIINPVDGTEHWNIEDPNDSAFVGVPLTTSLAQVHFVGIEKAPWGEPAVYFTAGGVTGADLWALDFFPRKVYPVKIGLEVKIRDGKIWQAQVALTDGRNLHLYEPGKAVVNVGMPRRDGIPPTLKTPAGDDILLTYMLPADTYLYSLGQPARTTSTAADYTDLFCYNGKGWHRIGSHLVDQFSQYCAIADYGSTLGRKLHVFGTKMSTNKMVVSTYQLPNLSAIPVYGIDHFEFPAAVITSWNDGGFADVDGALLKMNIDARHLSATETLKVEYQLNNDEQSAWLATYDASGVATVFSDTQRVVYFAHLNPQQGAQFTNVRFRFTLSRGTDDTHTPEVKALILAYLKKPAFRSTWTLELDINRMISTAGATTFDVDGHTATLQNVWAKLQTIRNKLTLVSLTVPSAEPHDLNVIISGMPMSFDDFRAAVGGHGTVTLKVLEPIQRA